MMIMTKFKNFPGKSVMKKTFSILCLLKLTSLFAINHSINPERMLLPPIDIFSKQNKILNNDLVEVKKLSFDEKGNASNKSETMTISLEEFQNYTRLASAVYKVEYSTNRSQEIIKGTAFHIGHGYILTNHHVLSKDRSNLDQCLNFSITDSKNHSNTFSCKKVHFCSQESDFCLIEINDAKQCKNFFCTKYNKLSFANNPSLKITKNSIRNEFPEKSMNPPFPFSDIDYPLMAIGNTLGLGTHVSIGKGFNLLTNNSTRFYAPIRAGNSGGPLINKAGIVVGVIKQESEEKNSNTAFNIAFNSDSIYEELKQHFLINNNVEMLEILETLFQN